MFVFRMWLPVRWCHNLWPANWTLSVLPGRHWPHVWQVSASLGPRARPRVPRWVNGRLYVCCSRAKSTCMVERPITVRSVIRSIPPGRHTELFLVPASGYTMGDWLDYPSHNEWTLEFWKLLNYTRSNAFVAKNNMCNVLTHVKIIKITSNPTRNHMFNQLK